MSDQPSIPIPLTPERRLARVAAILARGIMGDARITPPRERLSDSRREPGRLRVRRHEPHQWAALLLKPLVHEEIAAN